MSLEEQKAIQFAKFVKENFKLMDDAGQFFVLNRFNRLEDFSSGSINYKSILVACYFIKENDEAKYKPVLVPYRYNGNNMKNKAHPYEFDSKVDNVNDYEPIISDPAFVYMATKDAEKSVHRNNDFYKRAHDIYSKNLRPFKEKYLIDDDKNNFDFMKDEFFDRSVAEIGYKTLNILKEKQQKQGQDQGGKNL